MRYALSKYVQALPLDDDTFVVAHGPRLQRTVVAEGVHAALMLFAGEAMSRDEFVAAIEIDVATPRETLGGMFDSFVEKGLIVPEGSDEDAQIRAHVRARMVSELPFVQYQIPHRMTVASFEVPAALAGQARHLEVLILGGCLAQLAEEPLRALAPAYGLSLGVRSGWLTDAHLLAGERPDLVIVQPGVYRLLAPLWGGGAYWASEAERRRVLDATKQELARILAQLDDFTGYVLVQGVSTLQAPPAGRADDRMATGHHRIVFELNELMREAVAGRANAMFVDEERLAGNHGKARLFDDMITATAHHGTLDSALPQLLAREYLECYAILSGARRIKAIITDLDNTLWAGVVGEGAGPDADRHPFPAIREALALVQQRGVMLATCSKNNEADALAYWRGIATPYLTPDDCVLHRINWDAKSGNVATILEATGLGEDAVLFVDDNPVERAEVAARFPRMRVLGDDLAGLRRALLTEPCLQPSAISAEARDRTATTRATIAREAARASAADPQAFLRSLEIRVHVARLASARHVERVVELAQRTNQFNTTLVRYDARALLDGSRSVWLLAVQDRFASYGLVGLCAVAGDAIENICISCRTLGLRVEQPFLAAVLRETGLYARRATGRIVIGERNQPCRRVFADAGFADAGDGVFARAPTAEPPAIDPVYALAVRDEAELTVFD